MMNELRFRGASCATPRMRAPRFPGSALGAALLLASALAGTGELAAIQSAPTADRVAMATMNPSPADGSLARAMEFEARAAALVESGGNLARAAGLYRRAAELRPDSDPEKVMNLIQAARLNHHAGRNDRGAADAAEAARVAHRQGDLVRAAHAYLDAAIMRAHSGDAEGAHRMMEEAILLSEAPLLPEAERTRIRNRVGIDA